MNKLILLVFLLCSLVITIKATVTPFSCFYTAQGKGSIQPGVTPANSASNCVTACYRLTSAIKLGTGLALSSAANSINSVIHTYISTPSNTGTQAQQASALNSAFTSTNAKNALPVNTGILNMGHIGILPFVTTAAQDIYVPTLSAAMDDFVAGDKGCLPILNMKTAPQANSILNAPANTDNTIASSNGLAWTITGTSGGSQIIGSGTTAAVGVAGDASVNRLHLAQTTSLPLQLAYNPFLAATVKSSAGADNTGITAPALVPIATTYHPNLLINAQINQVALDMAAIVTLFCVTNGVCCTTNNCNIDPAIAKTSIATQTSSNFIYIIISIIAAKITA